MSLFCGIEALVAAVIVWKAFVASNRMSRKTHHGIRAGWVLAGGAAAWWGLAALAGDPIRAPLVLTLVGIVLVVGFDRRGHGHS